MAKNGRIPDISKQKTTVNYCSNTPKEVLTLVDRKDVVKTAENLTNYRKRE